MSNRLASQYDRDPDAQPASEDYASRGTSSARTACYLGKVIDVDRQELSTDQTSADWHQESSVGSCNILSAI